MQQAGYYPIIKEPTFSQWGGSFDPGLGDITIFNPNRVEVLVNVTVGNTTSLEPQNVTNGQLCYTVCLRLDCDPFLNDPKLNDTHCKTTAGYMISANPNTTVTLTVDSTIVVRALVDGVWSPLIANPIALGQNLRENFKPTEIFYHSFPSPTWAEGEFEFIEFKNLASFPLDLSDIEIVEGISFKFPSNYLLAPQEYAVVCENEEAYAAAYPPSEFPVPVGQYSGALSDGGERIALIDAYGQTFLSRMLL